MEEEKVKKIVRENYAKIAKKENSCCAQADTSCCMPETSEEVSRRIGYSTSEMSLFPKAPT